MGLEPRFRARQHCDSAIYISSESRLNPRPGSRPVNRTVSSESSGAGPPGGALCKAAAAGGPVCGSSKVSTESSGLEPPARPGNRTVSSESSRLARVTSCDNFPPSRCHRTGNGPLSGCSGCEPEPHWQPAAGRPAGPSQCCHTGVTV